MRIATFLLAVAYPSSLFATQLEDGFDGVQRAHLTQVNYTFHCGPDRLEILLEQRFRDPEQFDGRVATAVGVEFVSASIRGLPTPASELIKANQTFRQFAWVDNLSGRCRDGSFYINVFGMPLEDWAAHLDGRRASDPTPMVRVISISPTGIISALP